MNQVATVGPRSNSPGPGSPPACVRPALGAATFDRLRAQGAELSIDQAVALALDDGDEIERTLADSGNRTRAAAVAERGRNQRAAV